MIQLLRFWHYTRITSIHPVNIGKDITAISIQRRRQCHSGCIRPSTAKRGDPVIRAYPLKTGNNRYLTFGHAFGYFCCINGFNACRPMRIIGMNGNLPAQP